MPIVIINLFIISFYSCRFIHIIDWLILVKAAHTSGFVLLNVKMSANPSLTITPTPFLVSTTMGSPQGDCGIVTRTIGIQHWALAATRL
jgi:hypothetical protein